MPRAHAPLRLFRDRRRHGGEPSARALIDRANSAFDGGRERDAEDLLLQAVEFDPAMAALDAKFRRACELVDRPGGVGDLEAALRIGRELLIVHPGQPCARWLVGAALDGLGLPGARSHFEAAVRGLPERHPIGLAARLHLAEASLREGDFKPLPDYVRRLEQLPARRGRIPPRIPLWDGGRLDGRTIALTTMLDGHGDALQFIRYVPMVKEAGGEVTLVCHASQRRLLARCGGVDRAMADGSLDPQPDCQAPLTWLPAILGISLATIPGRVPYLSADEATTERWQPVVNAIPGFKVGIAWQGNPEHLRDALRSFRLAELAPLAAVPGVQMVSLQKGHGAEQLTDAPFPVLDLGDEYAAGDWLDTAAVVSHLDLVISPDSAIAHLAGALGKPVWVALHTPSEWRWLRDRDDSPWYPRVMRLFRQARPGEWGTVFRRMADELAILVRTDEPRSGDA